MVDRPINEIYDDTIIKYTLNIPLELYARITKKTRKGTKYGGRRSVYLRELIERDLVNERPVSGTELKTLMQGEVTEPARRFSGFIDGLLANSFRWVNFRRKHLTKTW